MVSPAAALGGPPENAAFVRPLGPDGGASEASHLHLRAAGQAQSVGLLRGQTVLQRSPH